MFVLWAGFRSKQGQWVHAALHACEGQVFIGGMIDLMLRLCLGIQPKQSMSTNSPSDQSAVIKHAIYRNQCFSQLFKENQMIFPYETYSDKMGLTHWHIVFKLLIFVPSQI